MLAVSIMEAVRHLIVCMAKCRGFLAICKLVGRENYEVVGKW